MMTINLLPWRDAQRHKRYRFALLSCMLASLLLFIISITITWYLNQSCQAILVKIDHISIDQKIKQHYQQLQYQQEKIINHLSQVYQQQLWNDQFLSLLESLLMFKLISLHKSCRQLSFSLSAHPYQSLDALNDLFASLSIINGSRLSELKHQQMNASLTFQLELREDQCV